ncbi:hypothetical protein CYLTODRAFT_454510 [Cylindrobasidium torrendii FP15055 ss-10]|uniref:Uncharacterized protein n=1 Tax=Cylindrobasidium torrendii FP15055 ss-10 TaxID=1314674 RepID=A0A0D7BA69_9AGAR|nr:hypothetical protein CYLTODRAFT_454510 [Cylindrobasidium torrendii FP15055 ss-10]
MQYPTSNVRGAVEDDMTSTKYHYTHPSPNTTFVSNFELYRGAIQQMFDRTGEFSGMPQMNAQLKEDLVEYLKEVEEESEYDDSGSVDVQDPEWAESSSISSAAGHQSPVQVQRSTPSQATLTSPITFTPDERQCLMMTNSVPAQKVSERKYATEFYTSLLPSVSLYKKLEKGKPGLRTMSLYEYLEMDPWVTNIQHLQVTCVGCGKKVNLDNYRGSHNSALWIQHRNRCDAVYEEWCAMNRKISGITGQAGIYNSM